MSMNFKIKSLRVLFPSPQSVLHLEFGLKYYAHFSKSLPDNQIITDDYMTHEVFHGVWSPKPSIKPYFKGTSSSFKLGSFWSFPYVFSP